jgi:hypothetical protein
MAFQYSVTLRNNQLAQILATMATAGATLKIFSGSEPANCAAGDPTGLLATIALPTNFMSTPSSGAVTMNGSWSVAAVGTGNAASFRMYDSGGVTCHVQGSAGIGGSGADLILNNASIAPGQTVSVTTFTVNAGNS